MKVKLSVKVKVFCSVRPNTCTCIAWKGRPKNDLYCVGWDVKSYLLTYLLTVLMF